MDEDSKLKFVRVTSLLAGVGTLFIPLVGIVLSVVGIVNTKTSSIEGKHYFVFNVVILVCAILMWILSLVARYS
ncbi:MAG: hypothetical protein J6X03_04250 [Bacilli bacterium]|nr:hypothetical protein [Bacilli bacterium]